MKKNRIGLLLMVIMPMMVGAMSDDYGWGEEWEGSPSTTQTVREKASQFKEKVVKAVTANPQIAELKKEVAAQIDKIFMRTSEVAPSFMKYYTNIQSTLMVGADESADFSGWIDLSNSAAQEVVKKTASIISDDLLALKLAINKLRELKVADTAIKKELSSAHGQALINNYAQLPSALRKLADLKKRLSASSLSEKQKFQLDRVLMNVQRMGDADYDVYEAIEDTPVLGAMLQEKAKAIKIAPIEEAYGPSRKPEEIDVIPGEPALQPAPIPTSAPRVPTPAAELPAAAREGSAPAIENSAVKQAAADVARTAANTQRILSDSEKNLDFSNQIPFLLSALEQLLFTAPLANRHFEHNGSILLNWNLILADVSTLTMNVVHAPLCANISSHEWYGDRLAELVSALNNIGKGRATDDPRFKQIQETGSRIRKRMEGVIAQQSHIMASAKALHHRIQTQTSEIKKAMAEVAHGKRSAFTPITVDDSLIKTLHEGVFNLEPKTRVEFSRTIGEAQQELRMLARILLHAEKIISESSEKDAGTFYREQLPAITDVDNIYELLGYRFVFLAKVAPRAMILQSIRDFELGKKIAGLDRSAIAQDMRIIFGSDFTRSAYDAFISGKSAWQKFKKTLASKALGAFNSAMINVTDVLNTVFNPLKEVINEQNKQCNTAAQKKK